MDPEISYGILLEAYKSSGKRLLLLDYDGTLVPFSSTPGQALPGPGLLQLICELGKKEENDFFLISGRNSSWLEKYFGSLPVNLVAEHGAKYKIYNQEWCTEPQAHNEWKLQVNNIMNMYVRRCAHSFIEEKEYSIVWHYRNSDSEMGKLSAIELAGDLNEVLDGGQLQVLMGNKIVEVRLKGFNKGSVIRKFTEQNIYDYILAVGDDRTDEDMFSALMEINRKNTFTIKVGPETSLAQYNQYTPQMVVSLLENMRDIH